MSSHWLWAAVGAALMFPLKMAWDAWLEKFWTAFWLSFKAGFRQTPNGRMFFKAYHEARAKKDAEIAAQHPELKDLLQCKKCGGTGTRGTMHTTMGIMCDLVCDDCGGTGWV